MTDDETESGTSAMDSLVGRMEADLARGRPQAPVEPPPSVSSSKRTARRASDGSFAAGACAGVAACAVLLQIWLAFELGDASAHLAEFDSARSEYGLPESLVPTASKIALSPVWQIGAAVGLAIALLAALAFARRRVLPLAIVAGVSVGSVVFTYVAAKAPFERLAGEIKAE
jgi:hypothetical protein